MGGNDDREAVGFLGAAVAVSLSATAWMALGADTAREFAGTLVSFTFTAVVGSQLARRILASRAGRENGSGDQWVLEARQTACWTGPAGEVELVRWDGVLGMYFVNGSAWLDPLKLTLYVVDLECRGYTSARDEATRVVREALGVHSWGETFA